MSDPFSPDRQFDIAGLRVFVAMPSHRDIHPLTVKALLDTQNALISRGVPVGIEFKYGSSVVHHARSRIASDFLATDYNRLFWVDSDIVWQVGDFLRLLAMSTVMDIVAAAYPAKQDPTIFLVRSGIEDIETNEQGCLPLSGFGMGFCCIHRRVIEDLAETAPRKRFHMLPEPIPHIFFTEGDDNDDGEGAEGEDMAFFRRAAALGYTAWVDPAVELGHIGPKVFNGRLLDHLQQA